MPFFSYVCDIDRVPDFNVMYELFDPCSILFFWRNKHIVRFLLPPPSNALAVLRLVADPRRSDV